MPINSHVDFKILNFINKSKFETKTNILKKFPDFYYQTEYRLERLSKQEYEEPLVGVHLPVDNSSYLLFDSSNDTYELTSFGKSELYNYKKSFAYFWFVESVRSVVAPIIVAFLTTIITLFLIWYRD